MMLNALGLLVIIGIALNQNRKLTYDRTTLFLLWFTISMFLSNIFNFQFNTIITYLPQVMSTIIIFVLTQTAITKEKQVDKFILIIIYLILFICLQCYIQITTGANWGGLEPLIRSSISGNELQVVWFGILNDPNDLGMLLIAFVPYIYNKVFYQGLPFLHKIFWLIALLGIGYTVILTNSRGSMLALMGGIGCFYIIKKRSLAGYLVAGGLAIALLAIAPSRMGELGSGDYSAMGRVYAWILALELLAMNPIFGIGAMHFLDYHGLTTHNSYVLAMVENGVVGFIGYFGIITLAVYTMIKVAYDLEDQKRSTEVIALVGGMLGILISIFFISRTYVLLPFLYIAIMMTYIRVYCPELHAKHIKALSLVKIISLSLGFIVFIYIFNRLATTLLI
jgi:hypothetical protein